MGKRLVKNVMTGLAILSALGMTAAPAFAQDIPAGTVVFGDGNAYNLDYANQAANIGEIQGSMIDQNSNGKVWVEGFSGNLIDNVSGNPVDPSVLPHTLTYKAKDGTQSIINIDATVVTVSAINGTITVTLPSTPTTTPAITDFAVTNAGATVVPTAISTTGNVVTLTVPTIAATSSDQSIVYSVSYKGAAAVAAPPFIVKAPPSQAIINNSADLLAASTAGDLVADGKTTMKVEVKMNVPNFVGQAEFFSQIGLKAAQQIASFDSNGMATFYVTLNNSNKDEQDQVYIKVSNPDGSLAYVSPTINLTYKAYIPGGSVAKQNMYSIDKITPTSMNEADRVNVYVANVANQDVSAVEAAIIAQLKLYNDSTLANPINAVAIVDATPLSSTATTTSYSFTTLLQMPGYNEAGTGDIYQQTDLAKDALTDDQLNYYSVDAGTGNVYLATVAPAPTNNFMLVNTVNTPPRINMVEAPTAADPTLLQPNTLLAQFNESMNRLTAENPSNWILNGHQLTAADIHYGSDGTGIRVMDLQTLEDTQGQGLYANNKAIANTPVDQQRNNVLISLTNTAAVKYLIQGQNLLQVQSVSNIAGLTDESAKNTVTTQNFLFNYDKPATNPQLQITEESPEQWVLHLTQPLFTDQNSQAPLDLSAAGSVKVELLPDPTLTPQIIDLTADTEIRALPNGDYILDLTKDWTEILAGLKDANGNQVAYHNNWFKVSILPTVYDVYGVKVNDNSTIPDVKTDPTQIPEDVTSPTVTNIAAVPKDATMLNNIPQFVSDYGDFTLTMSEPSQLFSVDAAGNITDFENDPLTPSTIQDPNTSNNPQTIPVPTFEYVKIVNNNPSLMSVGTKIDGTMYASTDIHNKTFSVKPDSALDAGQWKLVVRQISDDVGNTMATQEFPFNVNPPVLMNKVDPYIVWAYADDNKTNADGTTNDYVHILYSRQMSIDAIRAETYSINGIQLDQNANITQTPVILFGDLSSPTKYYGQMLADGTMYKPDWRGELVTIKLPSTFINGGDDILPDHGVPFKHNVLTVPTTLTAVDDSDATTYDKLEFGNNGGSNQYELRFDNNYGVTGITDTTATGTGTEPGTVPPITYAPDLNYQTVDSYINGGAPVDPAVTAATALVVTAETSKTQADVTAALAAVNALPDSTAKTALLARVNAIVVTPAANTAVASVTVSPAISSFKQISIASTTVTGATKFTVDVPGAATAALGQSITINTGNPTVTVNVLDASGNVLATGTLDVSATAANSTVNLTAQQPVASNAAVTVAVSPAISSFKQITVTQTNVTGATQFTVDVAGAATAAIGNTITVNTGTSPVTLKILDASGNVLKTGSLDVSASGNVTVNF